MDVTEKELIKLQEQSEQMDEDLVEINKQMEQNDLEMYQELPEKEEKVAK